jgi:hypothetical protein
MGEMPDTPREVCQALVYLSQEVDFTRGLQEILEMLQSSEEQEQVLEELATAGAGLEEFDIYCIKDLADELSNALEALDE